MPSAFVSVRLSETISSNHRKRVLVVAQNYRNQSEFIGTNRKSIGERARSRYLVRGRNAAGRSRWIGGACRWVGRCLAMTAPHLHESSWKASRAATWFGGGMQRGAAGGSVGRVDGYGRCLAMTAPHLHESSWGASRAVT